MERDAARFGGDVSTLMQKSEQAAEGFGHTASGMWANGSGLTKYASDNVLSIQFAQMRVRHFQSAQTRNRRVWKRYCSTRCRSKASLLRQVLREAGLQLVQGTHRRLGNGRPNYRWLPANVSAKTAEWRYLLAACCIGFLGNEGILDTFLAEVFHCHLALSHPLVEISNRVSL